uniref:Uncharacterized protein n=1 Tax=Arundo donax TaxID=35708 RepID=A0A0A9FJ30_ARUDO
MMLKNNLFSFHWNSLAKAINSILISSVLIKLRVALLTKSSSLTCVSRT